MASYKLTITQRGEGADKEFKNIIEKGGFSLWEK